MSVTRRSGRSPARMSFTRRNERPLPTWGSDPRPLWQRFDWRLAGLIVGWTALVFVAAYVGLNR